MEANIIPMIAAIGGFAVPAVMSVKLVADMAHAWRSARDDSAKYLELIVNGKDYSLDLKSITNGGSDKIHDALRELEHCQ